ncbi:hypothetical protein EDD18DRAFT_1105021 [Armillaria luteobubalina]|uniref:Uncharacterized protein n=1 Tax=Armillaria luteobubalina TaxID=153913 RepID=A0AA39Q7M4_9AGAR|nr:hypothetical protein EDD18DRAFT_1105021 [Armillaria luteobubalina]
MDQFYNKGEAMRTVDSLTDERVAKDKQHLAGIHKDEKALQSMHITYEENAQVWRLAKGEQEMVFTVTGAIATMDLPPVVKETLNLTRHVQRNEGQTEVPQPKFIANLKEMQDRGEREFRQGQLMEWAPAQVQGFNAIKLLNRLVGDRLEHTEDNEVKYFRGIAGEKKSSAEAATLKMKLILRALALVNCDHTMNADKERKKGDEGRGFISASKRMKRKVGFEYSDSEEEMGEERSVKRQQQANIEREDMHTDTVIYSHDNRERAQAAKSANTKRQFSNQGKGRYKSEGNGCMNRKVPMISVKELR